LKLAIMSRITCLLFILFSVLSLRAEKGKVYLIPGSDTSINPYILNQYDNMLWAAQLYANPSMYGHTVMDTSFRNQHKDSYGNPLKMTWWMMGGNVFDLSRNCNIPIRTNMTLYLMKKYHLGAIRLLDDQLTLHYHNYVWTDPNGDGIYHWNQGMDFLLNRDDYEETLCKYLIEDDVFPISFRSGWHYMDNAWQAYQEKFIPFDMSNAYPANGGSLIEPTWWIDWSQSPSEFVPYHPNSDNYQIQGDLKQWRLRSLFIQDFTLLRNNLEIMFQEAANGNDQMACVWGHLAESSFLNGLNNLNTIAHQFSAQYGVKFRYCKDVEAMRMWINPADTIAPVLSVSEIVEGENRRFSIETDGPIFQEDEPFIAVKTIYETYKRLSCTNTGINRWETNDVIPASILAKVAVAVCDSVGNQTKAHIDFVPDDIFVDDQHPEFQEMSGTWEDYFYGELWDLKARLLHGIGSVTVNPDIQETRAYKVSFHGPESNSNHVRFIMNSVSMTDTVILNTPLLGTDKWQQIGVFHLESGQGNTLIIENLSSNKDLGLDVIRFSPLVAKKQAFISHDSLNFGEVCVSDTAIQFVKISNLGFDDLNIFNMTHSGGKISIRADFPMVLASMETRTIPIAFFSQEYGEYDDIVIIHTDDPLHSMTRVPVYANVLPYFIVADNDDSTGYQEFGAQWFTSNATAYGPSSRCAWIQGNGMHADFTKTLDHSGTYNIEFIVPTTQNAHDHADYVVLVDGSPIDTVVIDQNLGSGQFVSIGEYDLPQNVPIILRVQDNGGNTNTNNNGIVLRADAVRFNLTTEEDVIVNRDSLNFGEVSVSDTTIQVITIRNLGFDALNILSIAYLGDKIFINEDFPLALAHMEVCEIAISFFSQEFGEYEDTIVIQTDDSLHPVIRIPAYASVVPYFKVADNEDITGYEEFGADWFSINESGYGSSSRCAWVQGNGMHADFTKMLRYSDTYDIQFIVPATEDAHDHADYIIIVDGLPIDTIVVDQNLGSGQFVSIGEYDLPKDVPITVRIQDNGGNTNINNNGVVLRADAVKFKLVQESSSVSDVPDEFMLFQNYPNPFNLITHIPYGLSEKTDIKLSIYDITGRKVRDWNIRSQEPGWHEIIWDGLNLLQQQVASGIYIYEMHTGDFYEAKKMILLK
jgi:hypothetical protein